MPAPDRDEPIEVAAWRVDVEHAKQNLKRELSVIVREARNAVDRLNRDEMPNSSDARRLAATVFEANRYSAELETLMSHRPEHSPGDKT